MANGSFDLDVSAEKTKLLTFFQLRTVMSSYSRGVLYATLYDPTLGNKPDWYDTVVGHLTATQTQSQRWFDTVAPPLTALPQTYINFADSFLGQMPQLIAAMQSLIASQAPNDDKDLDTVKSILDELATIARAQSNAIALRKSDLHAYLSDLAQAINGLTEGANTVNDAIADEKKEVQDTTDAIAALQMQLQADIRAVIGSSVVAFIGLIGMIVAIALAVANPVAGMIAGAVVGALVLAGGVIGTALTSVSVVADQNAIIQKQSELSTENQQIVVLNSLALTLNRLTDTYKDPGFDLSGLAATWSTMNTNLEDVRDLIIAERTDKDGLRSVLADFNNLASMLEALTQFSTQLQEAALTGDATPIQILTIPTQQAA
jgi:hypothetical protein